MRYSIRTDESLIFRDGKPFGSEGAFGGNSFNWVMPQTLTGMVRTNIGIRRDKDYFTEEANRKAIFKVGIQRIMNMALVDGRLETLTPIPADILFTEGQNGQIDVHLSSFSKLEANAGTDIKNKDWLYPLISTQEKPYKKVPQQLLWRFFEGYLKGEYQPKSTGPATSQTYEAMGLGPVFTDLRIHNGLNPKTLTTGDGLLFSNKSVYFWAQRGASKDAKSATPIQIDFDVIGADTSERLGDTLYLGGERRTIYCSPQEKAFSENQYDFKNKKFLKLVLQTHGSFGSWCPDWLRPDFSAENTAFVSIPETALKIRLRSACIAGWEGVSGWDYSKKRRGKEDKSNGVPKAMKKIVKPGSVYLIEVENPSQSEEVANYFWGNSLSRGEEKMSGYGLVLVANVDKQIND